MQCTIVNGSSLKKKRHKIHWGPCCHRNQCYSLLLIINGGFCYHSLLQTSLFPALCYRMQHPLPIHKYFMTTGCCVSSLWITLGLSHPLPNSCGPVRERLQFLHFFISLHASVWKVFTVPPKLRLSRWLCSRKLHICLLGLSCSPKGRATVLWGM